MVIKKLINIVNDALKHIEEKYHYRVYICDTCESNNKGICSACGCFITSKAAIPTAKCPKDKW